MLWMTSWPEMTEEPDRRSDPPPLPATTTREEDRQSEGQRRTQRLIALSVTWMALSVAGWLAIMGATESVRMAALVFLFGVANLVIGFYFGKDGL